MEKIKLLLYCTKSNKKLFYDVVSQKYMYGLNGKNDNFNSLNGYIVAECDFEVEEIKIDSMYYTNTIGEFTLQKRSCLNSNDLFNYLSKDKGYAIHIKNLNIFDKPRELNECWKNTNAWIFSNEKLYVAPQNMRYCGDWNLKKAILISIRPEWLCKILNGEKTIEVRKKVLKEMMQNA